MAAIPLIFVGSELVAWAAAAVGGVVAAAVIGKEMSRAQQAKWGARAEAKSDGAGGRGCPPHNFASKDVDYIAKSLGIDRKKLGTNIHRLKKHIENNPDILICCKCGRAENPGGDYIGNVKDF